MADTYRRPPAGQPAGLGSEEIASLLTGHIGRRTPPPAPPHTPPVTPSAPAASDPGPADGDASTDAAAIPRVAGDFMLPVGWEVIEALQAQVSAALSDRDPDKLYDDADRRALARSLATSTVADWSARYAQGNTPLTSEQEHAIATAVFDAMYRGGRLQGLLDEPSVEDVMVDGLRAHVEYYDKPRRTVERIADSHDELVAWVNRTASVSGHGERSLSQSTPMVGFRMQDGSRVTASLLTSRPSVVIRKHRIRQHGVDELVRWGSINPILQRFLTACVHARLNLLIVGDMGAGKTSLLRALGREIPAAERVVTLESDRELYLDEPGPKPGPVTFAFEARQSNGERSGDNRMAGEITIADMFPVALRYNATRVIVGEVRSAEVVPMLQAMSAGGSGSMCTLHVRRPHAIISRLTQLCTEAGMATEAAHQLIASAIDIVVYLSYRDETGLGGRKHRYVSHVYEVHDVVGEGGRPTTSEIFAPTPHDPRGIYQSMPTAIDDLERTGLFDRRWLTDNPHGAWGAPLETVRPR